LGFEVLADDVRVGYVLRFFHEGTAHPMSRFRGLMFYWILGYNTSL